MSPFTDILRGDERPLSVDLGFLAGFELYIDAGEAFFDPDQIDAAAKALHQFRDVVAGEAGHEAESDAFMPQITEDNGDVDALSAGKNVLICSPVYDAGFKIVDPDNIIQRRVECNCVDHL